MTANDKKVRDAKKVIKTFRDTEEFIRSGSTSRSTGIRNVYKSGYELLERLDSILNAKAK